MIFYLLALLLFLASPDLGSAATRYADNGASGCSDGSTTYDPTTRTCGSGSETVYVGVDAVQNASDASSAMDIVLIRSWAGIYTGTGRSNGIDPKNGSSFGTDCSNCTVYMGYGGAASSSTAGCAVGECPRVAGFSSELVEHQFIFLKNLIVDGSTVQGNGVQDFAFGRVENVTVRDNWAFGFIGTTNIQVINADVHGNGRAGGGPDCGGFCHGFYGQDGDSFLIDGGKWHDNASLGIQCYPGCTNSIIRNIEVFDNGASGLLVTGTGNLVYNIIAYGNGFVRGNGNGVHIANFGMEAYNITSFNNNGYGICVDQHFVTVRNAVVINNRDGNIVADFCNPDPQNPVDYSVNFTQSHNVTAGSIASPVDPNAYFADVNNGDFRLCETVDVPHDNCTQTSPAVDAGTVLGAPYIFDLVGNQRTGDWDAGALESSASGGGGPSAPSPALLVALSGDAIITDESGLANHGTLVNGATYTNLANGKYNEAFLLDGVNDSIDVADSASLDEMTHSFTMSAWVYPLSTITDWRAIMVKNYRIFLYAGADSAYCGSGNPFGGFTQGGSTPVACEALTLPVNTWTFVSITYDESSVKFGRNGTTIQSVSASGLLTATTGTLQIGASQFGENLHARVDNIRVYNYARSDVAASGTCDDPGGTKSEIECDMDTPILSIQGPVVSHRPLTFRSGTPFRMGVGTAVLRMQGAE